MKNPLKYLDIQQLHKGEHYNLYYTYIELSADEKKYLLYTDRRYFERDKDRKVLLFYNDTVNLDAAELGIREEDINKIWKIRYSL